MTENQRPFRFGIGMRMVDDLPGHARRAEALGYDMLLMPDHFLRQFAIGPALATVAAATTTLRIGTLVIQNDLRHPALLAMEAATLDVLSSGRFELGIGAGGSWLPDFETTGIPFDPPGVRVGRLEESISVLKQCFGPDPFSFEGTHYRFTEFQSMPKPVQPRLPFLIAGGGPRMLRLAAREADIVGILPLQKPQGGDYGMEDISLDAFTTKARYVRDHAGDRAADIEFNLLIQMLEITDDREATIARLKAEHDLSDAWFDSPMVLIGTHREIADRLCEIRAATGISYFAVHAPMFEPFGPIISILRG